MFGKSQSFVVIIAKKTLPAAEVRFDAAIYLSEEPTMPLKGIFWFVKESSDNDFRIITLTISPEDSEFTGNSKNGQTYNHKLSWNLITENESREIKKQEWNYFPRGRVEITRNKAAVYLNPVLNEEKYQKEITAAFDLSSLNVRFISDGSEHYKSKISP